MEGDTFPLKAKVNNLERTQRDMEMSYGMTYKVVSFIFFFSRKDEFT